MDKYLMSSPTQLSQPIEAGSDSTFHMAMDVGDFEVNSNSASNDHLSDMEIKHYSNEELVPVSSNHPANKNVYLGDFEHMNLSNFNPDETLNNQNSQNHNQNRIHSNSHSNTSNTDDDEPTYMLNDDQSLHNFNHSKNVSLDDGVYSSQLLHISRNNYRSHHQSNLSTSSMISMSQDPPIYPSYNSRGSSTEHNDNLHNSFSSNTIYSMDSIPQLSSSVSNQSLSDSPNSMQKPQQIHSQHQQNHLGQPVVATPRRMGRNKSLSVSSVNNNLFHTPLRGGPSNATALSPINLATNQTAKISKTPHSSKAKGHTRSRSRISVDANTPMVLGASKSSSYQNLNSNLNPFYTPSTFVSPRVDNIVGDLDDIGTPLPTPGSANRVDHQGVQFFSPTNWSSQSQPQTASNNNNTFGGAFPTLKRNDTLESIKIEDQDDDAFKQLRKAVSYSSFPKKNETNTSGSDFNATKMNSTSTVPDDEKIVSSISTPGVYYAGNSPVNPANFHESKSYSVPNTSTDYESEAPYSHLNMRKSGIDLLSAQFIPENKPVPKNLSNVNTSFTKSYPASIDLASIATSPMDASLSAPPTMSQMAQNEYKTRSHAASNPPPASASAVHSKRYNPQANPGLLPPMATFSNQQQPYNDNLQGMQQYLDLMQMNNGNNGNSGAVVQASVPDSSMSQLNSMPKIDIPVVKNNRGDKNDKLDPKKKHKCPICDSRFQRPEHVKRHMKSHSSDKPYQCDETTCGKRFNRKDNLKAHLKKIHGRQT